jgi:hypothetical protein
MRVSDFCFLFAILAGTVGIGMGIVMGMIQNFALAPAHAHLNLLGWVSMALYGLYHRGVERASQRLAWLQAGCGAVGFPLMAGGLAIYLGTGSQAPLPFVIAGSFLFLASMLLFAIVVAVDIAARNRKAGTVAPVAPTRFGASA